MKSLGVSLVLTGLLVFCSSCTRNPEIRKREYVKSGNRYFDNGKYREASLMYRKALQVDMRFGEAYYRYALAELKLGKYIEAVRAFRRSVELDPQNTDAHGKLADIYLTAYATDANKPKQLLDEIRELSDALLKRDAKSYQGLRLSAFLDLASKNLKGALEKLQAANAVQPMQPAVILPLVQALAADGRFEEAEKLGRDMIATDKSFGPIYDLLYLEYLRRNRAGESEAILKLKASNNPKDAAARLQLAAHYLGTRRRADMLNALQQVISDPVTFPRGRLAVGDFYQRIGELDSAVENYREGIKSQPKDKLLYQKQIVVCLARQRKLNEASELVETVLKESPKDTDALAMRASLVLQSGDRNRIQSAISDLQAALARSPNNPVLRYEIGRAYLMKGDIEQARVQFQEAIKARPDYMAPRLTLARMDLARSDFAKAMQSADEILKLKPDNPEAKLVRATAHMGLGDLTQARAGLEELLKAYPQSHEAAYRLGTLAFRERNLKQAEEIFRKLYEANPPDARGLGGLVEVALTQQKPEQALKLVQGEVNKAPTRLDYRLMLANTALRTQNYALAVTEYQHALNQQQDANVYMLLGETYRQMKNHDAAYQSFEKASQLAPSEIGPLLQMAMILEATGRGVQAKSLYEQVLKSQPDHPIALNNLAYMLAETGGDLDHALTLATRAKQKWPTNQDVADTLGWIYIKKNLSDSAIDIFRDLVIKSPDHVTFRYHLAMALFQKGDRPQAKKELLTTLQKLQQKPDRDVEGKVKDLLAKIN